MIEREGDESRGSQIREKEAVGGIGGNVSVKEGEGMCRCVQGRSQVGVCKSSLDVRFV